MIMKKIFTLLFVCASFSLSAQLWTPTGWESFRYPDVEFENMATGTQGWNIYQSLIPEPEKFIQQHARWVAQTLYWSASDSMPDIQKIRYTFEDKEGISAKGGRPPMIHIFYSSRWVEKSKADLGDEKVLWETRGVLYHELTHGYQLEPQGIGGYKPGTEFFAFIEGMADAVRADANFFPIETRKPGGSWMDGYRTTGFFLHWLKTKDPDFIRKFNRTAIEIIPWSFDKAMRHVLGAESGIEEMWAEYQEFLVKEKARKEAVVH